MSGTCDLRRLSPNTVNNLCKLAIACFEKALHSLKERRGEDYTAMDLLKECGKHTPYMVELLLDTEWRKHDNFYNKKSAYMAILYQAFLDFCETNCIEIIADELDKSTFKGKVNCYFSEYRNNISKEEEKDQVMQKVLMNTLPAFIRCQKKYINTNVDFTSFKSIITNWIDALHNDANEIVSWKKRHPLSFEELVIEDFDWVIERIFIGGKRYDCAYNVVERELKGTHWKDDLTRDDVKKALIKMIYWAGVSYGVRDNERY